MTKSTKVITIANQKGGCAKTTTVISLASSLSQKGKKVLIIDMDSQANASGGLGIKKQAQKEQKTLTKAIRDNLKLTDVRIQTFDKNVDIIASDISLNRATIEMTGRPKQFHILTNLLSCNELSEYDFVIVDTHPYLDCMLQSAFVGSHYIIVPMFAEPDPFDGIVDLFTEFKEIKESYNRDLKILGIVITRYESKNSTHKKFSNLLKNWGSKNGFKIFDTFIPMSSAIAGARSSEKSVVSHNMSLPVSQAYISLTEEILIELDKQKNDINISRNYTNNDSFDESFSEA